MNPKPKTDIPINMVVLEAGAVGVFFMIFTQHTFIEFIPRTPHVLKNFPEDLTKKCPHQNQTDPILHLQTRFLLHKDRGKLITSSMKFKMIPIWETITRKANATNLQNLNHFLCNGDSG